MCMYIPTLFPPERSWEWEVVSQIIPHLAMDRNCGEGGCASWNFVFCSFQSGLFSCQSLDLCKTQTSPSGTCSIARTLHICFSLIFPSLERTKELFSPSYAYKAGWGICDEWILETFLLATVKLVLHSLVIHETLICSLDFSQKELWIGLM